MNYLDYIFLDFETGGKKKYTSQPTQLAAVAIDGRKLKIHKNGTFESMMRPVFDAEACAKAGIETVQDEALAVTGQTLEDLEKAPDPKIVWKNFTTFVNRYNHKGGKWNAPILVGFNNNGFDDEFVRRMCKMYGPYDKEYDSQSLFHPFLNQDLMKNVFGWFENSNMLKSWSMDSLRDFFGLDKENAHDALCDVEQGADLFIRLLQLQREVFKDVKWKDFAK